MKQILLVLALILITTPSFAENDCSHPYFSQILNACQPDKFEKDTDSTINTHEAFDWGFYLNPIFWETNNTEWGLLGTYLNESEEGRILVGGKIYLNRFTWQKDKKK